MKTSGAVVCFSTKFKHAGYHLLGSRLGMRMRAAGAVLEGFAVVLGRLIAVPPFVVGFSADSIITTGKSNSLSLGQPEPFPASFDDGPDDMLWHGQFLPIML